MIDINEDLKELEDTEMLEKHSSTSVPKSHADFNGAKNTSNFDDRSVVS